MNKIYFEVEDNVVIKYTPMPEIGENTYKTEVVMTKEIFQECYKRWIESQDSQGYWYPIWNKWGMSMHFIDKDLQKLIDKIGYKGCKNCRHQISPLKPCKWLEQGGDGQIHFICPKWDKEESEG